MVKFLKAKKEAIKKFFAFAAIALVVGLPLASLLAPAANAQVDYTIQASDTIPIFQTSAASMKANGLAVLNAGLPWLVGAIVSFFILVLVFLVIRHFSFGRHR